MSRDKFVLIDAHALIYRAFYALPKNLLSPAGQLTNAAYGFTKVLLQTIDEFEPKYMAVAFDHKDRTKRRESYEEYKANRAEMPDELKPQIELCKQVVRAMKIPLYELSGFEADDLIGTISRILDDNHQVLTLIVTGDKDLLQLVDDNTHVFIPSRGQYSQDKEYDAPAVVKKMGVDPKRVVDLKALMGDGSDNIPGVKGIGAKTAVNLLQEYKTVDQLLAKVAQLAETGESEGSLKGAVLKKLIAGQEMARLSYDLAMIDRRAPIEFNLNDCLVNEYDKSHVVTLFRELGFNSLVKKLPNDEFESQLQEALF